MNFLYLFKVIIDNIDSVVISLITGIVTSIFVSRIFLIKESEEEKINRLKPRREVLYPIAASIDILKRIFEDEINKNGNDEKARAYAKSLLKYISPMLEEECKQFLYMEFTDLDEELHSVAVKHNDIVEEMKGITMHPDLINNELIERWKNDLHEILDGYKKYFSKTSKTILYKKIWLDRYIIVVIVLMLVLLLIG